MVAAALIAAITDEFAAGEILLTVTILNRVMRELAKDSRRGLEGAVVSMHDAAPPPLKVLHVFRSPVGGLFRHVIDLAEGQIARGHQVGMIVSSLTGGERAEATLRELEPRLALGLVRIPMHRPPHPADAVGAWRVTRHIHATGADVLHGHGAKGGAFARLASAPQRVLRVYTPHGGSLWYNRRTLIGWVYLTFERLLMLRPTLYLFESAYGEMVFREKIGNPKSPVRVVHNGVSPDDFQKVTPATGATDLLFLGELRQLKGVDVLLRAVGQLNQSGRRVSLTIVGDGDSAAEFRSQTTRLGLDQQVRFTGAMPGRAALPLGRIMVVPSRAESLPYVVLEAAAAGKPVIATRVGGIPEIFGPLADLLVPADDATALSAAIARTLDGPDDTSRNAETLRRRIEEGFTTGTMVESVLQAYGQAIAELRR
jgi:glycosyltransferase involved in cell wall biosynthesis